MEDIDSALSIFDVAIKQLGLDANDKFKSKKVFKDLAIASVIANAVFGENAKSEDVFVIYDRLTKDEPF